MPRLDAEVLTVAIASGQSLSSAGKVGLSQVVGLDLPAIDSATLSFQVSADGVTYRNAYDAAGAELTTGAATVGNRFISAPATLAAAPFIKIRTGTAAVPVAQAADRAVGIILK